MSEFVDECRREWRRLGVPDPIANEMAADLEADLEEAESEGGSAEDVLGNSAFDPRRFAAAWAGARGVTRPLVPSTSTAWRPPVAVALTALLGVLVLGAGLALLSGHNASSIAIAAPIAVRKFAGGPLALPYPPRLILPPPFGPFDAVQVVRGGVHLIAWMSLAVGIVGLGLLAVFYWSSWWGTRRHFRNGRGSTPGWN